MRKLAYLEKTWYNTKVISAGCWSGVDNYAIDKRFNTRPETVLSVIDINGLVCNYDIKLNWKEIKIDA